MRLQFFTVSAKFPEESQQLINTFCAHHRVLTIEKQFVDMGAESYWSVCISYVVGSAADTLKSAGNKRERIDYKEVLGESDFACYAQLRDLRKMLSEQEGVPAYALFTNEQLAEMVTRRIKSHSELAQIDGVGKARLEKYGEAFIKMLNTTVDAQTMQNDKSGSNEKAEN